MACLDENIIAEFVEGTISVSARAQAEAHFQTCAACRSLIAAVVQSDQPAGAEDVTKRRLAETVFDRPVRAPSKPSTAPAKGSTIGRYVVLEALGAGGMGIVYAAYDPVLERKVALKLVRDTDSSVLEELRVRMLREGKSIAQLSHPNIVNVYDMGTVNDDVFIAMELVGGGSLKTWLAAQKRPWREVLAMFLDAGEGLHAAHQANLVHRDFKPENVLLGNDGRVRVTDFGLARSAETTHSTKAGSAPVEVSLLTAIANRADSRVTQTGALLGTPAYMAPEQFAGRTSGAKSDQFSFCVALWEALYGDRPYSLSLADNDTAQWTFVEPKADAGIPLWVRRILERGLKLEPEQRYQSMGTLLHDLRNDPDIARRARVRAVAMLAVGIALLSGAALWLNRRNAQLCQGAPAQVAKSWNAPTQAELRRVFTASGAPDTERLLKLFDDGLSAYWSDWATTYTSACEATRMRGEQSDQVLSLRMACLERRRAEANALIDVFKHADAEVVAKAPEAVDALTSIRSCSDIEALLAQVRPPEDEATRTKLDVLRVQLTESKALFDAGKYKLALERAAAVAINARALGYRPVIAESLLLVGRLQERLGDLKAAEQTLLDAIVAAEASKHDLVAAEAATHLMLVLGVRQARYPEAHTWGKLASAAVGRLGGSQQLQAELLQTESLVLYAEGQVVESIARQREAVALFEKLAPGSLSFAEALNNLGAALRGGGQPIEATTVYERALAIVVPKVGTDSDVVAVSRNGLASAYMLQGRVDEAIAFYREALERFEKVFGPNHFRTVQTVNNLGVVAAEQGKFVEALPLFERVLQARQATLRPTDSKLADAHSNVAMLLVELGRLDDAQAHFDHAKAILQGYPIDHFGQSEYLLGNAKIAIARKQPLLAIEPVERVLALCAEKKGFRFDYTRARAQFVLAQALWDGKRDRSQARQLAHVAQGALVKFGEARFRRDLSEIERWLAAHVTP